MAALAAYVVVKEHVSKTPIELDELLRAIMYNSGCIATVPRKEKPDRSYTLGDHITVEHYKKLTIEISCEGEKEYIRLNDVIMVYDKISNKQFIARYVR
jgi:hypothetical protein